MLQYLLQYTELYLLPTTVPTTLDATVYLCILLPHKSTSTKPTERTPRPRPNVAMLGRVPPKGLIFVLVRVISSYLVRFCSPKPCK